MPFGGQTEFLQRLAVELQDDLIGAVDHAELNGMLEIASCCRA